MVRGLFIGYALGEYEAYIQTPEHLYQYSRYYDDLYLVDGESYYLMDEKSRWNRKRGRSGKHSQGTTQGTTGSGIGDKSGKRRNSGNSYSDADDYADEYAEYYMEEGYDYDDAYDEAYDEWED